VWYIFQLSLFTWLVYVYKNYVTPDEDVQTLMWFAGWVTYTATILLRLLFDGLLYLVRKLKATLLL
jgi:hypothetical protein